MKFLQRIPIELVVGMVNIIVFTVFSAYTYQHGLSVAFSVAASFLCINLFMVADLFIFNNFDNELMQDLLTQAKQNQ